MGDEVAGAAASRVNGIRFVDSLKLSRNEIELPYGDEIWKAEVRPAVMPEGPNVTAETAEAGEYATLMLKD